MNILVIGGGGREHAIIQKLKEDPRAETIYALPGNGGIAADAQCVAIGAKDIPAIVEFVRTHPVDFAVVAPDDPLVLGAVDALEAAGVPCFGPTKDAAAIEGSKVFAKDLMRRYGIPTASYEVFYGAETALSYVETCPLPTVVKADGLALGKGVLICETREEARQAVRSLMEDKIFGESGARVVVEEFLTGPEVSVLAFTDGKTIVPMPSSQDHKRVFDGNRGPNTGGMGAISPVPTYTPELASRCMEEIFRPTVDALRAEGRPFQGVLYFGLMLTPQGPKVVEYNARFGDPECQVVLSLLDSDLMDILQACVDGTLDQVDIRWKDGAACVVVLASGGYPTSYEKGFPISGLEEAGETAIVFHAGTKLGPQGEYLTNGGRVLGVTATGGTLEEAIAAAYDAARKISFEKMHFRTDIGRAF